MKMTQLISDLGQARRDFASVMRIELGIESPQAVLSEAEES
jgi:hypothetical protein